jgi:L-malate glycosyltransferase
MPQVLHVFATFTPAGPQVRTAELMGGLGDGFQHTVVAMDGRTGALELCPEGTRVLDAPRGLGGMRALLKSVDPDLLCTYNWGAFDAVLSARLAGRRAHLHHEDGFNADEVSRRKPRRNLARRLALGRAHRVIVPSRTLERIAREEWRVPAARLELIVNGVDTLRFTPEGPGRDELRTQLGIPADALVLGAVGHLRPVKRYDRLLRATRGLDAHLILVGDGPERADLEALATDRVHLVGHQTELAPWYRAMDVLCISSDSEQLPVTLLEAMACGLPACGTDVGDVRPTMPEQGRDLFTAPGTPEALAEVIGRLAEDAPRRATLGQAGVTRVREVYSLESMVAAYRAVYLEALG